MGLEDWSIVAGIVGAVITFIVYPLITLQLRNIKAETQLAVQQSFTRLETEVKVLERLRAEDREHFRKFQSDFDQHKREIFSKFDELKDLLLTLKK